MTDARHRRQGPGSSGLCPTAKIPWIPAFAGMTDERRDWRRWRHYRSWVKVVPAMERRHFTLEAANAMLPWLRETMEGMMPVREELANRQEELLLLLRVRRGNGASSKEQEAVDLQRTVDRLTQQLQTQLLEVAQRGIVVRDLSQWLVDFPSYREGREVFLCWVRGEDQIGFWHETNTGFSNRQPL